MINLYLDTSGSMSELGKDSAQIYLVKSIEDYYHFKGIGTTFFALNGNVIEDITCINYSNDMKIDVNEVKSNNILLSDGLFQCEKDYIFDTAISIGIDSDMTNLRKISHKVFTVDDILSGLEYLLYKSNLLNQNIIVENNDDEDEW